MSVHKLTATLLALGLSTSLAFANVPDAEPAPKGPTPKLTRAEEAGFVLAESLLSITAAFITRLGCKAVSDAVPLAGTNFRIQVNPQGTGEAYYPDAGLDPIELAVISISDVGGLGAIYDVDQKNGPGVLAKTHDDLFLKIDSYDGDLRYSDEGAILISKSTFDMYEYGLTWQWQETNIKDFWRHDQAGAHIRDTGLEVISKVGYPLTKWRQTSTHWRWGSTASGGLGEFRTMKWLITPYAVSDCVIELSGQVNQMLGLFIMHGKITVLDLSWP